MSLTLSLPCFSSCIFILYYLYLLCSNLFSLFMLLCVCWVLLVICLVHISLSYFFFVLPDISSYLRLNLTLFFFLELYVFFFTCALRLLSQVMLVQRKSLSRYLSVCLHFVYHLGFSPKGCNYTS